MTINKKILLIEDDSEALLSLSRALKAYLQDVSIDGVGTAEKALEQFRKEKFKVVVLDLELVKGQGPSSGLELLTELLSIDSELQVIVLTGHSSLEFGIESIKKGAKSFLEKPADVQALSVLISNAFNNYEIFKAIKNQTKENNTSILSKLAGKSNVTEKLKNEILFAASTNQSVYLTGESGVGKGLCASLIHQLSNRKNKKYIRYQPTFLSSDLVNSDLFGHKKGSFTGADKDRDGLLKDVDGGTLFLDEIDALPVETQVQLLGVLQDKLFRQVGTNIELKCDFRLISASNAIISEAIKDNKVRKDFYFRIAHHTISIPPLRERIVDIPDLVDSILMEGTSRKDFSVYSFNSSAELKLKNYSWPGNIRELQAIVEGAAYRAQYASRFEITEDDIIFPNDTTNETSKDSKKDLGEGFHIKVLNFKKHLIREALARNGGNQVQAAKELGLDRSSMRRIIADEL
jgi:DNA-binding NtrC family response regulator